MSIKHTARDKILEAAERVSRCMGAGNLTLEAVAESAGVSKGGLLYHFPNKSALMTGMVLSHVQSWVCAIGTSRAAGATMLEAYLDFVLTYRCSQPPPSGLLAALAADPQMMEPVRDFEAEVLSEIRREHSDAQWAIGIYMAVQGIQAMDLLGIQPLTETEIRKLLQSFREIIQQHKTG